MQLEVGKIVEGKVTGITKFGAFVELPTGEVGMVHISEVAPTYVNDISEHLTNGQTVTVKVLAINEDNKISLSIKRAMKPAPRKDGSNHFNRQGNSGRDGGRGGNRGSGARSGGNRDGSASRGGSDRSRPASYTPRPAQNKGPATFEDMLSKFMASSDEKISNIKKSREVSRRGGQKRK